MPSFSYVARDKNGKTVQGFLDALTQQEAVARLRQENLLITKISSVGQNMAAKSDTKTSGRVSLKDKMFFTKQFHVMLHAGLGMVVCLNNLINQTSNKYFQYVIMEVKKDVEGGQSLSVALSKFPKVFDKMFVHMLEAGEASGKLDVSLSRMNDYFERQYNLKKKVIGSMIYPAVIVVVATIVICILFAVVLPVFADIFEQAGVPLPMITQALISIGLFVRTFWFILPLIPAGIIFAYIMIRKNPKGGLVLDRYALKLPLFGDLILKLSVSRFTMTFATLMDSGVPMLQSLEIVQRTLKNAILSQAIRTAAVSVSRGTGLAQPLESIGIFPSMVSQMITIGEETGDLSRMLEEVSNYYDKEVGYAVENLTAMIEPLIIVVLGIIVSFVVAAIMIPMFQMSSGATLGIDK